MTIQLFNSKFSVSINTFGAELFSFKNTIENREFIWEGNPKFWSKHSPVLFPIVGGLKNNRYKLNNQYYQLSRHGFARDYEFEVIEQTNTNITFSLKENTETLEKYPFQFELQINYQLIENELIVSYKIINNSKEKMPFCIGAHPAFALPKEFENYSLEFEKHEELVTHELQNNLFSGDTRNINLSDSKLKLDYSLFEKDALVFKTLQSKTVTILENKKPILQVNYNDFSSLGIWTVQNAPFVCIEPWIGFADSIDSNENLFDKKNCIILDSNDHFTCSFSIVIL